MLLQAPEAPRLEVGGRNLYLTKIKASGKILPTLATLTIAQQFTNGDKLADVTYHAPLHPDWAVHKVTLQCGENTITTVVMPNQKAQETFEQARQDGHTAILADEVASDELRLQLANVPAGAAVEVTTEVIAWPLIEADRGSIIIPLINGPKYGGTEAQQPYLDENDHTARHTGCELDLELAVVNAKVDVGTISDDRIKGEIDAVGQITVTFDATPNALYHEDEQGKYLVIGVPAMRPDGTAPKSRKAILLDRSGSMGGQGLSTASEMARQIADRIKDELQFVYTFDSSCEPIWAAGLGLKTGRKQSISAVDAISHISARGGTELNQAFQRIHSDLNGQIDDLIVITDALVDQSECGVLVRSVRQLTEVGIAVHVIVVGAAPGRFIGDAISQASGGLYLEQTGSKYDKRELEDNITRFLQGGSMLKGILVDGNNFDCKHPVRGRPVMVAATPADRPSTVSVNIDGHQAIKIPITDAPEARFIWAREMVLGTVRAVWASGSTIEEHKAEIEKIGVDHQILTPFTSMVGLDPSQTHNRSDVQAAIAQASLPVGVDASAFYGLSVGGTMALSSAGETRGWAAFSRLGGDPNAMKSALPRMAIYSGLQVQSLMDASGDDASDDAGVIGTQINYVGKAMDTPEGPTVSRTISGYNDEDITKRFLSGRGSGDLNFDNSVEQLQLEKTTKVFATPDLPDVTAFTGNRTASLLAAILANITAATADPFDGIDVVCYGTAAMLAAVNALRLAGAIELAERVARLIPLAQDGTVTITHGADKIQELANMIANTIAAGTTK